VSLKHIMKSATSTSAWKRKLDQVYFFFLDRRMIRRVYSRKDGVAPRPALVYFDVTNRCNLKCEMCYLRDVLNKKQQEPEVTTDEFVSFVRKEEIKRVNLIGGEPFLRRDLLDMLEKLGENGITCESMTTNGTLITEKTAARLAPLLARGVLRAITFSIDGPEDVHDLVRGKGTFAKARCGIELLRKELTRAGGDPEGQMVVNSVIMKENYERLDEVASAAADLGFKHMCLCHLMFATPRAAKATLKLMGEDDPAIFHMLTTDDPGMDSAKVEQMLRIFYAKAAEVGVKVSMRPGIPPDLAVRWYCADYAPRGACMNPFTILRVGNTGDVYYCTFIRKALGNIRRGSLDDIWNSAEFKGMRKAMVERGIFPICVRCCKMFLPPRGLIR